MQNGILDSREHKADVVGVSSTREVRVYDLLGVRVEVHEYPQNVFPRCNGVSARALKLREVVDEMRVHDLLLQQILLIEEEDDGRVLEPRVRDDGLE